MDMMSYLMGRNSGSAKKGAKIEVVTELPETGEANVIYLVPKETEDENNVFDEYLYINDEWELIGSTAIDISGKQDTMQFSTMPNAGVDYLGKIVQYTGTTNANYTNGYFYICVSETEEVEGETVTSYSWNNIDTQNDDDIIVFKDPDDGTSVTTINNNPENIENLRKLAIAIENGKNPFVFFCKKTISSGGSGTPYRMPVVYSANRQSNNTYFFNFYTIYPTGYMSAYIYKYDVQYGVTNTNIYTAYYSLDSNTNRRFMNKEVKAAFIMPNNTDIYRYPISSQYYNWTLGLSTYVSSRTYQVGDYVVRYNQNANGSISACKLYRCNTADTTGTWDATKWNEKTYMEYLSEKLVGNALGGSY